MEIISLVIADDHIIFRKGLRTVLNEIPIVKVIAEASNGSELLNILKTTPVDIVLMDIRMPVMDGMEATRRITKSYPDTAVICLTMHEEIGYFNKMIEMGAQGFLLKKTNKDQLENAIKAVYSGNAYYDEEFVISPVKRKPNNRNQVLLSEREKEVLEFICKGYSNAEIAKELGLSQRTIDGHKSRLFDKTGAKNAPNLVMFAVKNGLVKT
ncbi:MAG: response regulator transcription factor [Bacteroidetes bacterium]|nr:response regulator transcription factor [Bacteroidota bacterium]